MSHRDVLNLGGALDVDLAHLPFESALNLAVSRSWLEIDLDAIKTNISTIREISGREIEILLPVKADGYGHGASEIAWEAAESDIRWLGVASLEEALTLRRSGSRQRILLLTPSTGIEQRLMVANLITPVIADLEVARAFNDTAGREGVVFPVHIEVDTGMGRAGVSWKRAVSFIRDVISLPALQVEGVFSHFSSADEEDLTFTKLQLERFKGLMSVVTCEISKPPLIHISNSAAALRIKGAGMPMIRPGLFVYGVSPLASPDGNPSVTPLPAMSCRSRVVFVKEVEKGDPIGYGRAFVAPGPMRIATIAIGYRDGLSYRLSNRGTVLIRGKRCSVVGNICMDMLMVDTSSEEEIRPGDPVTILGRDGEEYIGAEAIASTAGTIPYDVVTKLGNKIPRLFFRGGKPVKISSCLGTWEATGKEREQRDR